MDTLNFIDGVLYVCLMAAALIFALILFHAVGLIFLWWRERKVMKYNNAGHRFFDRVK